MITLERAKENIQIEIYDVWNKSVNDFKWVIGKVIDCKYGWVIFPATDPAHVQDHLGGSGCKVVSKYTGKIYGLWYFGNLDEALARCEKEFPELVSDSYGQDSATSN